MFCWAISDLDRSDLRLLNPKTPSEVTIEFEVVNWTGEDVYGIDLEIFDLPGAWTKDRWPRFSSAFVDQDGRPLDGDQPPHGNLDLDNDWIVDPIVSTDTKIRYWFGSQGTPIPHRSSTQNGVTYDGLADPDFWSAPVNDAVAALVEMIPGATFVQHSSCDIEIVVPDPLTPDDGDNVLDGFAFTVRYWNHLEGFALNWTFLDANGDPIGESQTCSIQGDPFGFGVLALLRLESLEPETSLNPLFDINNCNPFLINTGWNPPGNQDENIDSPLFFLEDEDVNGIDQYPFHPIPYNFFPTPGVNNPLGTFILFEPAASVTAGIDFFASSAGAS
ncbi:MAG: hypothetical protein DWQ01_06875 [Planctomycetota bacterium]|nr:MAG: hypothetical protein DWQ01_06875 [Planctomycetota bacterium]